jgi:hypothetical protein
MASRALLVAVVLLCGRLIAAESGVPSATQIDRCEADPVAGTSGGAFSRLRVSCDDVLELLAHAKVVSESEWHHEYSHVAFGDRSGRLTLPDGIVLTWLVRPGGLAYLEWPDGRKTYLVRCCVDRPSGAAPKGTQP